MKIVSVDTEVYKAHLVSCGLAFAPNYAISIPLINLQGQDNKDFSLPLHDMKEVWQLLGKVLADESIEKVGQNFHADHIYWLEKAGFEVKGKIHDLMYVMRALYPELPLKLQFSTSIYTEEPYYKIEGKEYNPKKDRLEVLLNYMGKDVCTTIEAFLGARQDCIETINPLTGKSVWDFYENMMQPLYNIYGKMERKGIRVSQDRRTELYLKYKALIAQKEQEYFDLVGFEVNYDSPKQVASLIYGTLKCPLRKDCEERTLIMLMINAVKDAKKKDIIRRTIELRKLNKAISNNVNYNLDPDGRLRCEWKVVGTETGRSSTGIIKKPLRNGKWGISLHNLTKHGEYGGDIRSQFIPDEGCVFVEIDQAQAESRIADVLAEDYEFLAMREKLDTHKLVASHCYGIPMSEITDEQRQVGKHSSHAYDNAVGKRELSLQMSKHMNSTNPGSFLSEWRAGKILEAIDELRPKIKKNFHGGMQDALANNDMTIWNPFGRRRQFMNKWGDDLFKESYAHIKQSIVDDNTKRAMMVIDKEYPSVDILVEAHDGILCQVPIDEAKNFAKFAKEAFQQPIDFNLCTLQRPFVLTIPADVKMGKNWEALEKVKL